MHHVVQGLLLWPVNQVGHVHHVVQGLLLWPVHQVGHVHHVAQGLLLQLVHQVGYVHWNQLDLSQAEMYKKSLAQRSGWEQAEM